MSDLTLSRPQGATPPVEDAGRSSTVLRPAIAGAVAVLAAIGLSELVAGFLGGPSLLASIGEFVIDHQPPGAKDFVVGLFGTNDKLALEVLILAIARADRRAPRDRRGPLVVHRGCGGLRRVRPRRVCRLARIPGRDPDHVDDRRAGGRGRRRPDPVLSCSTRDGSPRRNGSAGAQPRRANGRPAGKAAAMPTWSRRAFLVRAGAIALASGVAGVLGRRLLTGGLTSSVPTTAEGKPVTLSAPVETATLPAGAEISQPGITPIVVPNDQFYRIDTALILPSVDASTWTLRVTGMVDHEVTLKYDRAGRAAHVRAVRHDRVRQQRGRRRPRRQREVDGRAAPRRPRDGRRPGRRDPDRRPIGRRVHGRLPDRPGRWTRHASR